MEYSLLVYLFGLDLIGPPFFGPRLPRNRPIASSPKKGRGMDFNYFVLKSSTVLFNHCLLVIHTRIVNHYCSNTRVENRTFYGRLKFHSVLFSIHYILFPLTKWCLLFPSVICRLFFSILSWSLLRLGAVLRVKL